MKFKTMELRLFLVTALLSVHVNAQLQKDSSTVAGFNMLPQDASLINFSTSKIKDVTIEQASTTQPSATVVNDQTSPSSTFEEASLVVAVDSTVVDSTTEKVTSENVISTTTQKHKTVNESTNLADVETNSLSTKGESLPTSTGKTIYQNVNQTTKINDKRQFDITSTVSTLEESSTNLPPEQFFQWLDSIHPDNSTKSNATGSEERNKERNKIEETTDSKNLKLGHGNSINTDMIPSREIMKWLDSIHPDSNATTVKNVIDTSIISTEKLIIVISTICGTFVLFVAILIAISCCRRNKNIRNDSEKSDFSMTSVVSIPEKRKSDVFSTDKNGFNNVFMGIPANNEVWKNLEQLSPAASSVMPESTKM